jgi:hypothetical protein
MDNAKTQGKLSIKRETLQHLSVRASVQTGRLSGGGGTGWTSIGGSCDNCTNQTGAVCPTNILCVHKF